MPPLPPFVEPGIPGSTVPAFSPSAQLYTHSTKFPIERQITLSSTEKNFKIPILNDIKKRSKGAVIAPDAPPKRLTAWTYEEHMQPHQTYSEHTHVGLNQRTVQHPDGNMVYRASYVPEVEMYGNHSLMRDNLPPIPPNEIQSENEVLQKTAQSVIYQTPQKYESPRDQDDKAMKGSRGVTKTYHALKDIISGKFRGRDPEKAVSELNNITENVKNPMESKSRDAEVAQLNGGQVLAYASSVAEPQQFNQQVIQQHNLQQQQPHQFYAQQLRSHQQQQQLHHFLPARPQAQGLRHRPDNQVAYQVHGNTPFMYSPSTQMRQPGGFSNVENVPQVHQTEYSNNGISMGFERRSAQQIERDNLKQKNLEARRTLSHPHLLLDTEGSELHSGPAQQPVSIRRGSLGNILDANINLTNKIISNQEDKESDEGGFVNRIASRRSCTNGPVDQKEVQGDNKGATIEHPPPEVKRRIENEGDRERASSNLDSGRGSAAYSSGRRPPLDDGTDTARTSPRGYDDPNDQENDSEWVDIVEKELRHILEPKLLELSMRNSNHGITMSTVSGSISSITPPLPPLSGGDNLSPTLTPKSTGKCKSSDRDRNAHYEAYKGKIHPRDSMYESKMDKHSKKIDYNIALRGKQIFGLDSTDFTSTTTRSLDLESILDGQSDSDANLSVADTKAIRKQLEGLENMYSEVLKFLGVNKRTGGRYQPSDPRIHKKRQGSMSSLPTSSVSSVRRERRYVRGSSEDRRRGREPRATNRRFQRLEAHVVTLARSVAHLSSEMRTQHLVIQEIESVRQEVAALRAQTNMLNIRSQSSRPAVNVELPTLANPSRVKKLTKFFGDEPPLVRLFLRKLGYEKYANLFENEKIGMVELPYLCEERLQKMGIPLGPRLRIMQEAQISVYKDNTLCIV
ncbi:uncharacterized protein [Euwallacea fornicatus]|uniref:uncharacterized protein isoform X1 n=1 Tax=Euwallacea fornicatus TaxID=995702 RepID=UPI00338F7877